VQYYRHTDGGEGGGIDMALLTDFRSRGIGAIVVQIIVSYLQDQLGWTRVTVDPAVVNVRGVEFWRRAGFVPVRIIDDADRAPYWLMEWPRQTR
jgi:ribosomal protein S18 acetylase RimI-like enzyme